MKKKTIIGIILVVLFVTAIGYGVKSKNVNDKNRITVSDNTMQNHIKNNDLSKEKGGDKKLEEVESKLLKEGGDKDNQVKNKNKEVKKELSKKDNVKEETEKSVNPRREETQTQNSNSKPKSSSPGKTPSKTIISKNEDKTSGISNKPKDIITYKNINEDETIGFKTETRKDPNLKQGTTKVIQNGSNGIRRKTFKITYTNGEQTAKTLVSNSTIRNPVNKTIVEGTKPYRIGDLGNSNKEFITWEEANNWANNVMLNSNSTWVKKGYIGYSIVGIYYSDGVYRNFTVDFYK